jgi:hypothetical protein
VYPLESYVPCDDLWVVTTYFNPVRYRTKRENYAAFLRPMLAAGIKLVTIECAFGQEPFDLAPGPGVIQVRGRDILWLRERLVNLAIAQLPPEAQKVAWVDNDLLFCNPSWAVETSALLEQYPFVQQWETLYRLGRDERAYTGTGKLRPSFAAEWQRHPEIAFLRGRNHGTTGGAWAARRSLVEKHGLYDAAIVGGGDELFSHAVSGSLGAECVLNVTCARSAQPAGRLAGWRKRLVRRPWPHWLAACYVAGAQRRRPQAAADEVFYAHYLAWAQGLYADVRGRVGCAPGMILHLWHGDPASRQHHGREAIPHRGRFDPATDLRLNDQGVWEWGSAKPQLHQEVAEWFRSRREDR